MGRWLEWEEYAFFPFSFCMETRKGNGGGYPVKMRCASWSGQAAYAAVAVLRVVGVPP